MKGLLNLLHPMTLKKADWFKKASSFLSGAPQVERFRIKTH